MVSLVLDNQGNLHYYDIAYKVKMIEQLALFRAAELQNNNNIQAILLYQGVNRPAYDDIQIKNYSDYLLD